jgi:hypothetical protein
MIAPMADKEGIHHEGTKALRKHEEFVGKEDQADSQNFVPPLCLRALVVKRFPPALALFG